VLKKCGPRRTPASGRNIICDFRPDAGVRLGPHFFNTEDELRHTVDELADIVASGAYAQHAGAVGRF